VIGSLVDVRLNSMRSVDVILAALQATFAMPNLFGSGNPFRFLRSDPINSPLWICDPEGRLSANRGPARTMILVDRADYTPMDLHLHNYAGGTTEQHLYADLGTTTVIITCEGGNRVQSETLAALVYQILKFHRTELMREFDIHELRLLSVGRANPLESVSGSPWSTTVTVRVETQESVQVTDIANPVNHVDIVRAYGENLQSKVIQAYRLDGDVAVS